ncbi:hypothetical protein L207DRAFT_532023 [Hyaloscypha variabilis F]|uniref:Uncharacterized protein n=1 Tax=Hyaloscypha variabilis (strain UAMH 11265 / GT02V1 / F) TaxID=1149755 RepID=A0A2J6RGX9_HYAVF|nr:hypothetical protein L207DRAFT_532023 [Hyaloscypha variabilis F]
MSRRVKVKENINPGNQLMPMRVSAESFLVKRVEGGASNRIVSNSVISTDRGFCVATTNLPGIESRPYLDPGLPKERSVLRGVKLYENNKAKQENLPAEAENIRRKTEKLNLPPGDHVLRIPRWGTQSCKHEIAMLRFVRSLISICVPTVNPLGSPYVLQFSVPEKRLDDIWPALNNTQRLLIGLDIARLCTQLIKITNKSGGMPDVEQGPGVYGTLRKTNFHFPGDEEASEKVLSPQPPVDMLCERLTEWAEKYPNYDGSSPYYGAIEVVRHMQINNRTLGRGTTHRNTISTTETSSLEISWLKYRERTPPLYLKSSIGAMLILHQRRSHFRHLLGRSDRILERLQRRGVLRRRRSLENCRD